MDVRCGRGRHGVLRTAVGASCAALLLATAPVGAADADPTQPGRDRGHAGAGRPVELGTLLGPRVRPVVRDTDERRFTARTANQGWYTTARVTASDNNDNYFAGTYDGQGDDDFDGAYRNFFSFDLSGVRPRIDAAVLVLDRFGARGDRFERLGLFGVRTAARRLNANDRPSRGIYRDLGNGPAYGRFAVPTSRAGRGAQALRLSDTAVRHINRDRGGWFSIGGALLSAVPGESEFLFGSSSRVGRQRLVMFPREPGR